MAFSLRMTLFLMNLAGLPPTTVHGSTSLKTAAQAPTTAPSPMVTPIEMNALVPIHDALHMSIGAIIRPQSLLFCIDVSCPAAHR